MPVAGLEKAVKMVFHSEWRQRAMEEADTEAKREVGANEKKVKLR